MGSAEFAECLRLLRGTQQGAIIVESRTAPGLAFGNPLSLQTFNQRDCVDTFADHVIKADGALLRKPRDQGLLYTIISDQQLFAGILPKCIAIDALAH